MDTANSKLFMWTGRLYNDKGHWVCPSWLVEALDDGRVFTKLSPNGVNCMYIKRQYSNIFVHYGALLQTDLAGYISIVSELEGEK